MLDRKQLAAFAKVAANYGRMLYLHQQSRKEVRRQQSNLENLQRWRKKAIARRAGSEAQKILKMDMLETRERIRSETGFSKSLANQVARLEHALEVKTRQLIAAK